MSFLSMFAPPRAARERREPILNASPENPSTNLSKPDEWLYEALGAGGRTEFGRGVTETAAMSVSAVFRCVSIISGIIAGLPLKVYRRTETGREEAPKHRVYPLLHDAPFPKRSLNGFVWRELWGLNVLLWGNHYSAIRYDNAARIIGFEWFPPWNVTVLRANGRNTYQCTGEDGSIEYIPQEDMLHFAGPGFDGIQGLSRIRAFARNSVGIARIIEESAGNSYRQASKLSGFATLPTRASPDAVKRFKAQFLGDYTGVGNHGRVVFGDQGTSFTPFQMSIVDLAIISALQWQVADISRFFGVPLHLLNDTEKSTTWGTGLSEQTLAFLIFTLEADIGRLESELNMKLFAGSDYYAEFDRGGLLAMDPLKAAQVAQTEISFGGQTTNEYRRKKNRPPVPGGDIAFRNSTNVPLTTPAPGAAPAPAPKETQP